jgi:hypothetical protein
MAIDKTDKNHGSKYKAHYLNDLALGYQLALCGQKGKALVLTDEKDRVTCHSCFKLLNQEKNP